MPKRSPNGPQFPKRSPAADAAPPPPPANEAPPAARTAPAPDLRTIDLKRAPSPAEAAGADVKDALRRNSEPAINGPAARAADGNTPGSGSASGLSSIAAAAPAAPVPDLERTAGSLRDALDRAEASAGSNIAEPAVPGAFQDIARPSLDDLQAKTGEAAGGMPGTDDRYGMPGTESPSFGDALRAPGLNLIGGAVADLDAAIADTGAGSGLPGRGSRGHGNEAYRGMAESAMGAMTGGTGSDPFAVSSGRGAMSGSGELGLMQAALDSMGSGTTGVSPAEGEGDARPLPAPGDPYDTIPDGEPVDTILDGEPVSGKPQPPEANITRWTVTRGGGIVVSGGEDGERNGWDAVGDIGAAASRLVVSPVGQVAGAFFYGWRLGRAIDNATGVGDKAATAAAGLTEEGRFAAEMERKAAEAERAARERDAAKQSAGQPSAGDTPKAPSASQPPHGTPPDNPALRAWIYEHHKDQIDAMRAGRYGWDVDPADDASDVPPAGNLSLAETAALQRGMTNFLIGNPGDPGVRGGTGSGNVGFGILPGDRGNIDYGPDAAGQWTGSARTEDPASALSGFGGSGLAIADAHGTADAAQPGSSSASDDDSDSDDAG
nr:hypothetical protein [Tepidiforma sp.]